LAAKNIGLVLKMLKIFSTQLRKIGKQAAAILSSSIQVSDSSKSLFSLGEYFLKTRKFDYALYSFHKYIEYYPNASNVSAAHKHIEMAKKGEPIGRKAEIATEDKDIVVDDAETSDKVSGEEAKTFYNQAKKLISNSDFSGALNKLKLIDEQEFKSSDLGIFEGVSFDRSLCLYETGSHEDSVEAFTNFIKDNPKTKKMKNALFYIGKSYQALDDLSRAVNFFKKVAGLPPNEQINEEAKKLVSELS
ncbi:MAG: tetratricopeptide repeat protein, partial [Spirochaetota bacterium]|nr:tetratricopeptide repeat protein [Spirochaetota bacterium]